MYNNIKTRQSRFSHGSRSGGRSRGNFGGKKTSSVNPNLYVNRAKDQIAHEEVIIKHKFTDFGLDQQIVDRVLRRGYETPTTVQDQAIPLAMAGRDVIGSADTGSGKTAAFVLPLLHKMVRDRNQKALIIVPTRELAVQIDDEIRLFSAGLGINTATIIGGAGFGNQLRMLQRRPQFVIGTPGRLKDHLNRKTLRIGDFSNLVLDEADRMVEMGFIDDIRTIVSMLPAHRQSLFFSATIMPEVRGLINSFMKDPASVSVKTRDTSENVDQDVVKFTDAYSKFTSLNDMLADEAFKKVLIFGRTKHGVEKLNDALLERGFKTVSIHGNKSQPQRQRALQDFKQDRATIMIATDVAARGLDIPNVSHVINYDAPDSYQDYIHRIGRTGRANNKGIALTFVSHY